MPAGRMLSEAFDRRITRHPWLTRALIAYTAMHCANLLPEKLDIYHQAARLAGCCC